MKYVLSSLIDITEIKTKDNLLFQQSKMASMGEMLANIAHQWRQPLNVISATTSVIKTKFAIDKFNFDTTQGVDQCKKYIDIKLSDIENYVLTLSSTIDNFRNFFKPQINLTLFTLENCIQQSLKLLMANFKNSGIKIITKIENVEILGIENEFAQVLINILNNAQDALLQNSELKKRVIFIDAHKNGDFAEIAIRDNAGGVDKDIIDKIFEPYFTTKHQTQGTGIGLYMSQEIIQKHMQGEISIKNISYQYEDEQYRGAKFIIKIPS
jgi:signal transduction histidine kinase